MNSRARRDERRRRAPTPKNDNKAMVPPPILIEKQRIQDPTEELIHDLKVFASVSIDKQTGKSKQCGIVQFETPNMAQMAIREMRYHPMDGAKLYVRGDVQESSKRDISRDRGVGGGDTDVGKRREEFVTHRSHGSKSQLILVVIH